MTQPFETTFILFADMLGFTDLVEKEGEEIDELSPIFTGVELYRPSSADNLLGYPFINFHRCLNEARIQLQEMGAGTAIVFSDSAFFRIETLEHAIELARSLMFDLVTSDIPVRMGIARGSYRMLRFLTDSSAHVTFHMSQFLGTGIVRADQAEGCGLARLRILLHPNLEPLLDKQALRIVPFKPAANMSLAVLSEVNYLELNNNHVGPDYEDCIQFDCLRRMAGETEERFQYHYIETFNAWNVMRSQLKRAPYPWEKFLDRNEYDDAHGIRPRRSSNS